MNNSIVSGFSKYFGNEEQLLDFFNDLEDSNQKESEEGESYKKCLLPYNLYRKNVENEIHTFIEINCAGYSKDNLNISYSEENSTLTLKGKKKNKEEVNYIYRDMMQFSFSQKWKLFKGLKFVKASYINGILTVEFQSNKEEIKYLKID